MNSPDPPDLGRLWSDALTLWAQLRWLHESLYQHIVFDNRSTVDVELVAGALHLLQHACDDAERLWHHATALEAHLLKTQGDRHDC